MSLYVDVVVVTGIRLTDRTFTYSVPSELEEEIQLGSSVEVPFGRGNRKNLAIVLNIKKEKGDFETKDILTCIPERLILSQEGIEIAKFMVEEYLSDYSSAISTVLPPGKANSYSPLIQNYYQITKEGLVAKPAASATRQKKILDYLKEKGSSEQRKLLKACQASTTTLKSLLEKNWISLSHKRVKRTIDSMVVVHEKKTLNPQQKKVFESIKKKPSSYLLCGVTGSGKTEIYLQLVEKMLAEGKDSIILVPEISLTPQTIARFQGRFGDLVAVLHSGLNTAQRYEEWEKIYYGEVKIAIGARSCIFAPFENLGLIVIDEEHENSYVSETNPKYKTRDIAAFRRKYHQATLVMGSATPSMESLYEASIGKLQRLDLKVRAGKQEMPEISIVDMREELKMNNRTMFSRSLFFAMKEALEKKEQIILFLNKRGHTSFVFCRACGYVYRCDACDVSMTYHKGRNRLLCHYCGREKSYSHVCPNCKSQAIKEFGAGTEMLEEETKKFFPKARVARADADTMYSKGSYQRIYEEMLQGEIDILLGTQMIAKGFDFPKVTVVGVVSADISLNLPDLRSAERSFQLITQVAGRAGRGNLQGKVFIQTYKPDHYAIVCGAKQDVDLFYQKEIQLRKENSYPPFVQELYISLSGVQRHLVFQKAKEMVDSIEKREDLVLLGPSPSLIERMNRRYRFGILLRSSKKEDLQEIGKKILRDFPSTKTIRIRIHLNPMNIY